MQAHAYVAIVTILALVAYFWMIMRVGGARRKCGIAAPQMTGDPVLERHIRVQANTLEWLPIFLPSLWLFALFWRPQDPTGIITAAIGLVWIVGRVVYALGYVADPKKRELGFLIQFLACVILALGTLGKAVWILVV
jgi:glutathione S-transferase